MEPPLEVRSNVRTYHVHVGSGLLRGLGGMLRSLAFGKSGTRCGVITDDRVAPLYGDAVIASLRNVGFAPTLVVVPAGEVSKSMSLVARVADELIAAGLDRHGFVVALGGGVIGDMAGFVASIYYRGIPFVQIPTTIVSQVDSSIGGKTGVNTAAGKNLLGSFYPPFLVLADVDTLLTLPEREFNEGFAEVIKHGAIRDAELLRGLPTFRRTDVGALTAIIRRNLEIKAEIVANDEYERHGVRALLNFGHTVGHAIEQAAGYGRYLHGEAISLGMVAACQLSVAKVGLPRADFLSVLTLLGQFKLPTRLPVDFSTAAIMNSLARDKKFVAGDIRFVLARKLGDAFLSAPGQITWSDLQAVVESLHDSRMS